MTIPSQVLAAYEGLARARITPIDVGLINETYEASVDGTPRLVVQRLHAIFAGEVCLDLDAVSRRLSERGLTTPRLVRTDEGLAFVDVEGRAWRAITYVPGRTVEQVGVPNHAFEAARLASTFHAALADFEHTFHFTRAGVHDTAAHLARLERWLAGGASSPDHALNAPIAEAILAHARTLEPLPPLPRRIVHGDLKISNVRFDATLERAVALLDLDTLAHGTMAFELGDALRSWAPREVESAADASADGVIVEHALRGYAAGGFPLTQDERATIILGLETVATELAARFAVDAWEDAYFGWDRARFASRREHDRARARSQLALAASVRRDRGTLEAIAQKALSK